MSYDAIDMLSDAGFKFVFSEDVATIVDESGTTCATFDGRIMIVESERSRVELAAWAFLQGRNLPQ